MPPSEQSPMSWMRLFFCAFSKSFLRVSFSKNCPDSIWSLILVSICFTTRPLPMVMWPTSEPPVWKAGSPTQVPSVFSLVWGDCWSRAFKKGALA